MIRNRLIRMAKILLQIKQTHPQVNKFDEQSWMELSGAVLLGLLIFNRMRPGELERALLTDLDMLVSINKDTLVNHHLNEAEQKRVEVYSRLVVRGKLARGVPVLLHDSFKTYLDLVLSHRKEASVHPENSFVFAAPQGNTKNVIYKHLWANTLMRRYSVKCGASDPERLRATTTRKHIDSNSASLKLNSEELEQLQGYLGHADGIHREYCRQPIAERDIINMERVLLAAQYPDHLESEKQKVPEHLALLSQIVLLLDHLACARTPATQEVVRSTTPPVKAKPRTMAQLPWLQLPNINQKDDDC
ncbi:hypothetical protein JTB14_014169 [Gonioctena quinquepunctata]|nr:hypothetical protein JTB14_014169 [Gonioctena quinquepunctata]